MSFKKKKKSLIHNLSDKYLSFYQTPETITTNK